MKKITPSFLRLFIAFTFLLTSNFLSAQLLPADVPSASQYHNSSKKYIEYIPGNMPVIISAPHGGRLTPSELPNRSCGTNEMDDNTDILIREIQKWCYQQYGLYPHIIVNNLRRTKLDPNRTQSVATCNNSTAAIYYNAFHDFIDDASADVTAKYGKGLYIDLHGQSHSIPRIEAGYNLLSSSFDEDLDNTSTNSTELSRVTIKNLIDNNIQNLGFEDLIRGAQSLGGLMQTTGGAEYASLGHAGCGRSVGYRTVPSHIGNGGQGSCDDTNPGNNSYFAGNYYNNIRHGSGDPSTSNSTSGGGSHNGGGGTIDGIMTEVNRRVRDLGNVYVTPYGYSDSRSPTIPYFARDYGTVIKDFIDLHYNDFSNFSYGSSSYDTADSDPTPTISGIIGGTFSSTSGLSINSSSGLIDVSTSTVGNYTVTYLAPNVHTYYQKTFSIEITSSLDDASFTYAKNKYCKGENNPKATITGETGGTFTSTSGLNFNNTSNGRINLNTSTPGTYTITYTTTDPGQNTSTFDLTINALDDASFSYAASAFCTDDTDPTPTITGLAGGSFSSTSGLSINSGTGAIDVSASTPGTYSVTYTTSGTCPNSSAVSVTINALDDASFSYAASAFCTDDTDPTPTITGLAGGSFSSTSGLSINASSGAIDVSASTPGTYSVTYTTSGTCPNSSAVSVTINALDDASFSYAASAFCTDDTDPTPTITGLAGGSFSSTSGLSINASSGAIDVSASTPGTYSVTYTTSGTCPNSSAVSVTINALDDASFSYAASAFCTDDTDPTPTITGLTGGNFSSTSGLSINASSGAIDVSASTPGTYSVTYTTSGTCPNSSAVSVTINALDDASFSYAASAFCTDDTDPNPTITGLTGGSFSSTSGLSINSGTGAIDVSASTPGTYSVTYTTSGTCPNSSAVSVTINALDDASFSYAASAFCTDDTDPNPTITGLAGGSFSSTSGLSINSGTGAIDASASTPGTYSVTYTTSGTCPNSSAVSVTINALDDASFSYAASAFCTDDTDPNPTITGLAGGSFSSTSGLSINASSGAIDVSTSTPGTYSVTYTTSGTCPNSSAVSVTINALDDASFSYSAATYDVNDSDPTPNFSGLTGGAFTSTTGIVLNSSDGTIDLSASDPGSYVITYTVTGTCNTVMKTQNVEITGTVLDIDDEELNSTFTIYPNPTINIVKIKSNKTITRVIVHDIIGRKIKSVKLGDEKQIDLSDLNRATYLLTFFNEGEMLGTKTVIKK